MLAINLNIGDVVLENSGDVDLVKLDMGDFHGDQCEVIVKAYLMAMLVIGSVCGGHMAWLLPIARWAAW